MALYVDLSPDIVAFLKFDVTGLSGPVETARLRLYVQNPTVDAPVLHTADPFSEGSITWNAQPTIGAAVSDLGPAQQGVWVEYDLTGVVVGDGEYALALVSQGRDSMSVSSRSGGIPPNSWCLRPTPPDPDDDRDAHCYANGDSYRYTHRDSHRYAHGICHGYAHHEYGHRYTHRHGYCNGDRNGHGYADRDGHGYAGLN